MLNQSIAGLRIFAKAGSPYQPRPRLASVMPSCVALSAASRLPTMRRAIFARRWPLITSGWSWVARILTMANSAATKNPFRKTRNATRIIFRTISRVSFIRLAEAHFPENHFENFFDGDEADFAAFAREDHRHALPGPLQAAQCIVHARIFIEINRW